MPPPRRIAMMFRRCLARTSSSRMLFPCHWRGQRHSMMEYSSDSSIKLRMSPLARFRARRRAISCSGKTTRSAPIFSSTRWWTALRALPTTWGTPSSFRLRTMRALVPTSSPADTTAPSKFLAPRARRTSGSRASPAAAWVTEPATSWTRSSRRSTAITSWPRAHSSQASDVPNLPSPITKKLFIDISFSRSSHPHWGSGSYSLPGPGSGTQWRRTARPPGPGTSSR